MVVLQIILSETNGTFWWSDCSALHMSLLQNIDLTSRGF